MSGDFVIPSGISGAGESILGKLLTRFPEPWQGRIKIGGRDIAEVDLRSLRSQVALGRQDLVPFSGTIGENIRLGKEDDAPWEIEYAPERADALPFLAEFPRLGSAFRGDGI